MTYVEQVNLNLAAYLGGDMNAIDAARILRLPLTKNIKYQPPRDVVLVHCNGAEYCLSDFDFLPLAERPRKVEGREPNSMALERIMACGFMQNCREHADRLTEPHWYAMVTQLCREPGGVGLIHQLSKPYPKYSPAETDKKILHAVNDTGPITCQKIRSELFDCGTDCGCRAPAALRFVREQEVDVSNVSSVSEVSNDSGVSGCQQDVSGCQQASAMSAESAMSAGARGAGKPFNLASEIREWVVNSTGSFSVADVDREFGLRTRNEKNARAKILERLVLSNLVNKDRRVKGKYHAIDTTLEVVDLENVQIENFQIEMPFGLSSMVTIPPKSVVMLAGSTNAGKTALMMHMMACGVMEDRQDMLYLMSEMGESEYAQRVAPFGYAPSNWQRCVRAASKSTGFDGIIKTHNPNGLSFVDYLEEIDGEYYKIPSDIRAIYDALGTGVAFIAIQKKSGALHGRGGEATAEKARLYLALDNMVHSPGFDIVALKIIKAKCYPGENPNGKEIHFKIIKGHKLETVSDWMYCNEKQRSGYKDKYERQFCQHPARIY